MSQMSVVKDEIPEATFIIYESCGNSKKVKTSKEVNEKVNELEVKSEILVQNQNLDILRKENKSLGTEVETLKADQNKWVIEKENLEKEVNQDNLKKNTLLNEVCQKEHFLACEEAKLVELEEKLDNFRKTIIQLNEENKQFDMEQVPRDAPDLLLDKLTNWHKENGQEQVPPPIFEINGVQFLFIQTHDLYFVCTTKFDVSPFMTFELLDRIATLIKDFCGSLSEEILRLNSGLVYELLDEVIDCGYPQTTSTNKLKSYVYEEPISAKRNNIIMDSLAKLKAPGINIGNSNCRPINIRDENSRNNEIFIDIIERIVASFASNVRYSKMNLINFLK
ncbi:6241_t:CDS:2 [Diversispora eburnea]|uniref:6241_t:CDS:1 n=1 Tax=Diversispora eburnea TaxID=1213867 RepID=A0A9N8ZKP7_9GLOM|nr:6241_t:CDS:2 [Diversispora eburnea]